MTPFPILTPSTASPSARSALQNLETQIGMVPNVFAVLASSPEALASFVALNQQLSRSSLTPLEREYIQTVVSVRNRCGYCVAGHSAFAAMQKLPMTVMDEARNELPSSDPSLEALRSFVLNVLDGHGKIDAATLAAVMRAGYSPAQLLDVVLAIVTKYFSNLTSLMTGIELDDAFQPFAWEARDHAGEAAE